MKLHIVDLCFAQAFGDDSDDVKVELDEGIDSCGVSCPSCVVVAADSTSTAFSAGISSLAIRMGDGAKYVGR